MFLKSLAGVPTVNKVPPVAGILTVARVSTAVAEVTIVASILSNYGWCTSFAVPLFCCVPLLLVSLLCSPFAGVSLCWCLAVTDVPSVLSILLLQCSCFCSVLASVGVLVSLRLKL
jgi:hypothetical protein